MDLLSGKEWSLPFHTQTTHIENIPGENMFLSDISSNIAALALPDC